MKKIFEIPELEVVRFVEADIVVCSGCEPQWQCGSYGTHCVLYSSHDVGCSEDVSGLTCEEYCTAVCQVYILDEGVVGPWGDSPESCEEWGSNCENVSGGYKSNCSSYILLDDEYGSRYWSFEQGSF